MSMTQEQKDQFTIDKGVALKNQSKGRLVLAHIYALNMYKIRAEIFTQEQLALLLQDESLKIIERMLLNGSMETAKTLIQSDTTGYFSSDEKIEILAFIDDPLAG